MFTHTYPIDENDLDLPEDHDLWCLNLQIKEVLLHDFGASEDHNDIILFLKETGLPEGTVSLIHKAIISYRP